MRLIRYSLLALPVVAGAQGNGPAPRAIPAASAYTSEPFVAATYARALPGGRVLVNDIVRRRVVLLDSTMAVVSVVVDSASSGANSYGTRPGGLIPYRGDSTLFIDVAGLSMLVIDPNGKIARVMSVPRSQDANALASASGAIPGFDASGKLVYRGGGGISIGGAGTNRIVTGGGGGGAVSAAGAAAGGGNVMVAAGAGGATGMPSFPDSAALTRVDMATRKLDTVAFLKIPQTRMTMSSAGTGMTMMTSQMNPLPLVDEWAVLEDGTIAIVRGRDYHVDFVGADGKLTTSPKIAYEWLRLSDEAKVALIDSAKKAMEAARASGQGPQVAGGGPVTSFGGGGGMQISINTMAVGPGGGAGPMPGNITMPSAEFIPASELPDYKPPFGTGAVRADRDGNLWVRTSPAKAPAGGGAVYDVINKKGELVDRVEIPAGRSIIGFAPGGVIYMLARTDFGVRVERTKVK